jgi:tropomodulin
MSANRKLYGKDLSAYDDLDVDELLEQLSPEEIDILSKEVDPDDRLLPPAQRCSYICDKNPTGPLNRKQLINHINKQALETPDVPELVPYLPGTVRGKKWNPPPQPMTKQEEEIRLDMGDEYEQALSNAGVDELVDLAAILGFHSMMNQDQYHASLLNTGQPLGLGWDGITKATKYKPVQNEPPNTTDVEESIQRVANDDSSLKELNLNNIKNISDEKFVRLFDALKRNTRLEVLCLANTDMPDRVASKLCDALEKNSTLRVLNVESNFITPPVIRDLIKSLLAQKTLEEFRAVNQKPSVLGNKIEMEITKLVEQNPNLLRLGLFLEYNDAQNRISAHLQKNCDKWMRLERLIENVDVMQTVVLQQDHLQV